MQHECAFTGCRRALVRRSAHADDGAPLGEGGQDLAKKVFPLHRVELVGVFQPWGGHDVVIGTQGEVVAIVGAGIGCHTSGRWIDSLHRCPQQAHTRHDEAAVRQAHCVHGRAAEHRVELRVAEDERIALGDQGHLSSSPRDSDKIVLNSMPPKPAPKTVILALMDFLQTLRVPARRARLLDEPHACFDDAPSGC